MGAALVGGLGAVAAAVVGAGELAVGVAAAYAGYRYLRKDVEVTESGHRTESQKSKKAA